MELAGDEFDRLVLKIIREHAYAGFHPTRDDIAQAALDHIRSRIGTDVQRSISRLSASGEIAEERDSIGARPHTYVPIKDAPDQDRP